jgi:hypothetical protein
MVELFSGALILADQSMQAGSCRFPCFFAAVRVRFLVFIRTWQSDIGASWVPVAQLKAKDGDLQLGLCRRVTKSLPLAFTC